MKSSYSVALNSEYTNGKWYIDMEVLEQSPKEIKEMVTTSMGFYCKY